ncbi:hypothetical protein C8Q74DRAFT_1372615 [Fomes fomentarius]|nr:hypothetical protein C8Q74DRAFT_1372615 [Fomes fomentarius]
MGLLQSLKQLQHLHVMCAVSLDLNPGAESEAWRIHPLLTFFGSLHAQLQAGLTQLTIELRPVKMTNGKHSFSYDADRNCFLDTILDCRELTDTLRAFSAVRLLSVVVLHEDRRWAYDAEKRRREQIGSRLQAHLHHDAAIDVTLTQTDPPLGTVGPTILSSQCIKLSGSREISRIPPTGRFLASSDHKQPLVSKRLLMNDGAACLAKAATPKTCRREEGQGSTMPFQPLSQSRAVLTPSLHMGAVRPLHSILVIGIPVGPPIEPILALVHYSTRFVSETCLEVNRTLTRPPQARRALTANSSLNTPPPALPPLANEALEAFARFALPDDNLPSRHCSRCARVLVHRLPITDHDYRAIMRKLWIGSVERLKLCLYPLAFLSSPELKYRDVMLGLAKVVLRLLRKLTLHVVRRAIELLKAVDDVEDSMRAWPCIRSLSASCTPSCGGCCFTGPHSLRKQWPLVKVRIRYTLIPGRPHAEGQRRQHASNMASLAGVDEIA